MSSPNWFKLRVLYSGIYPSAIEKLAEKLDVDPELIANSEGVSAESFGMLYIRRNDVLKITAIAELPDNKTRTIIDFADGTSLIIGERANKLVERVEEFLKMTATVEMPEWIFLPNMKPNSHHNDEIQED